MKDLYNKIVGIYAKYSTSRIQETKEWTEFERKYGESYGFSEFVCRVEKLKKRVETFIGGQDHPIDQVREALILLRRSGKRDSIDYAHLITNSYYTSWSPEQCEYFDKMHEFNEKSVDYFLSFTKRNASPGYENFINAEHRHFIMDELGESAFNDADKSEENLLAIAINKYLRDKSLTGFFYPVHLEDNKKVIGKLESACKYSSAFIQLIQLQMLTSRDGDPGGNYCYFEFCKARESIEEDRSIFIFAEPRSHIENHCTGAPVEYDEWCNEILARDPIQMPPSRNYDPDVIDDIRKKFEKNLLGKINKIKKRLVEAAPA